MKRRLLIAALLGGALCGGALSATTPAFAQERGGETRQAAAQMPLSRVLAMIAKRYPGRQLNTTMGDAAGQPIYIVQWQLTNGRIVEFRVDARTGQILGQ